MIYVGIDMAESFSANKFFPVKIPGVISELDMALVRDFSPFLIKWHIIYPRSSQNLATIIFMISATFLFKCKFYTILFSKTPNRSTSILTTSPFLIHPPVFSGRSSRMQPVPTVPEPNISPGRSFAFIDARSIILVNG